MCWVIWNIPENILRTDATISSFWSFRSREYILVPPMLHLWRQNQYQYLVSCKYHFHNHGFFIFKRHHIYCFYNSKHQLYREIFHFPESSSLSPISPPISYKKCHLVAKLYFNGVNYVYRAMNTFSSKFKFVFNIMRSCIER